MKRIVILHSGGLDSTIMHHLAKKEPNAEVKAVYFNIGHDYAWKEIEALPPEVEVHDMTWFKARGVGKEGNAMGNIFIPGRNMMFTTLAACKYVPDEIWLGALMGEIHEGVTDKNLEYLDRQNKLLQYTLSPFGDVRLVLPFVDRGWGKYDVVKYAIEEGLAEDVVHSSSCMDGVEGNCGRCGVCLRRAGIFHQLGLSEEYNINPWLAPENQAMILEHLLAERNHDSSHYDEYRRQEIVPAMVDMHGTLEEAINFTLKRTEKS